MRVAYTAKNRTITEILELLGKTNNKAVKKQKFLAIQETLAPFLTSLKALNTKSEEQPTSSDVKQILRTMLADEEETDEIFDELVQTGGAMFLLRIHYGLSRCC